MTSVECRRVSGGGGSSQGPPLRLPLHLGRHHLPHLHAMDLRGGSAGQTLVLHQVTTQSLLVHTQDVFRTDYTGKHVNGQGNFGFCSSACEKKELEQRDKLVAASDDDAVVFIDGNLAGEVVFPPS